MIEQALDYSVCQRGQKGIGLTEILVSLFIGLFILAGVVQMVGTSSQNAVSNNGISRLQENIRFAFARIEDDLARSGNLGCFSHSLNADVLAARSQPGVPEANISLVNNMLIKTDEQFDYANMIGGLNDLDEGSELGVTGTDTFYVRFVDQAARLRIESLSNSGTITVANKSSPVFKDIRADDVIMISDCSRTAILMVADTSSQGGINWNTSHRGSSFNKGQGNARLDTGFADKGTFDAAASRVDSLAYLYAGETGVYRYFIKQSALGQELDKECIADGSNEGARYCALFRDGAGNAEELVQGVHSMQIEYGWTSDQTVNNAAGNPVASPLQFATADTMDAANWNRVDRIKITLGVNSVEEVATGAADSALLTQTLERIVYLPNQI